MVDRERAVTRLQRDDRRVFASLGQLDDLRAFAAEIARRAGLE